MQVVPSSPIYPCAHTQFNWVFSCLLRAVILVNIISVDFCSQVCLDFIGSQETGVVYAVGGGQMGYCSGVLIGLIKEEKDVEGVPVISVLLASPVPVPVPEVACSNVNLLNYLLMLKSWEAKAIKKTSAFIWNPLKNKRNFTLKVKYYPEIWYMWNL